MAHRLANKGEQDEKKKKNKRRGGAEKRTEKERQGGGGGRREEKGEAREGRIGCSTESATIKRAIGNAEKR